MATPGPAVFLLLLGLLATFLGADVVFDAGRLALHVRHRESLGFQCEVPHSWHAQLSVRVVGPPMDSCGSNFWSNLVSKMFVLFSYRLELEDGISECCGWYWP